MRKISFYITIICCLHIFQLHAQDAKTMLSTANTAFEAKSFDDAIGQYQKILEQGQQSMAVYNNLGSAYYEKGDMPSAILYFEKGLKIDPFDKTILHHLSLAKEQLDSDIVQIPEFILKRGWKYMFTRLGSNTWYALGFLAALFSVAALGIWLLSQNRTQKKKGFFAGFFALAFSILFFFLSASQAKFQYQLKTAVILQEGIALKSAPEEANEAIMTLIPGTKLFIIDKIGNYEKVRLENGQLGWVPEGNYSPI